MLGRHKRTAILSLAIVGGIAVSVVYGSGGSLVAVFQVSLQWALPLAPMALGAAVVLAVGEIDLSIAGTFSFFGMCILLFTNRGVGPGIAVIATGVMAIFIGAIIGKTVTRFGVPALILTLGVSFFFAGTAIVIESSLRESARKQQGEMADSLMQKLSSPEKTRDKGEDENAIVARVEESGQISFNLAKNRRVSIPGGSSLWVPVLVGLIYGWRRYSVDGLQHVAVGVDSRSGRLSGFPVERLRERAFMVSSIMCWISVVLFLMEYQRGGWTARSGQGLELVAIATAVIGGTKITGGKLQAVNVLVATVLWGVIASLADFVDVIEPEARLAFIGLAVIVVAVGEGKGYLLKPGVKEEEQ